MKVLALLLICSCGVVSSFAHITKKSPIQLRPTSDARFNTALTSSVVAEGEVKKSGGQASIATSTFNLAKSVIGAGVLSLPSGVAFLSDEPSALIPASISCVLFGVVAAYAFSSIGKLCKETDSSSFKEAWEKTVSPKTATLISTSITSLCFLASLAYSIIMGDSFSSLFQTFDLPSVLSARPNTIMWLHALVLLPLCSLKSLTALAPFSILGLGGTLFTAVFMTARYLDKSYAVGGRFFADVVLKPSFSQRGGYSVASFNSFVLLSMLSTAFVAHYNAPAFLNELQDNTLKRFNQVVYGGFSAAIALFIFMMGVGFLTFGGSSAGFVLNNYSNNDMFATASRLAIGIALITGFPFTFSALREGVMDICRIKGENREKAFMPLTVAGLSSLTALAMALKDVSFVVSISGAMFGCAIMFVIPAIMNVCSIKKNARSMGQAVAGSARTEVLANYLMGFTGVVMGGIGIAISVLREMGKL